MCMHNQFDFDSINAASPLISCIFGNLSVVSAVSLLATEICCVTPSVPKAQNVEVDIRLNGSNKTIHTFLFAFIDQFTLTEIFPSTVFAANHTTAIILSVLSLPTLESLLFCSFEGDFGSVVVAAAFLNTSTIQCFTPSNISGSAIVRIVSADNQIVSNSQSVVFVEPPVVSKVDFFESSDSRVLASINGSGFAAEIPLKCRFDEIDVDCIVSSDVSAFCRYPYLVYTTFAFAIMPTISDLRLFHSDQIGYEVPVVKSFFPMTASVDGGVQLTVELENALEMNSNRRVDCVFGDSVTIGIMIENRTIMCVSPISKVIGQVLFDIVIDSRRSVSEQLFFFTFEQHLNVYNVIGVAYNTSLDVAVYGENFMPETIYICKLFNEFVVADYISHSSLQCRLNNTFLIASEI